ncbi:uncharacterized protein LOC118504239 [Anopheles stephensi]|uniref:uncharacterized protein LOC118504239 n=1 Tax=Anopheles stephensi TaxID=30069 RepID=UPI001658B179|nr:uncharacterized protein LOC118504239 [Anopheles stephensi]
MCSGATFIALCYFYACCNLFMSITAIANAQRASQIIGFDNCTAGGDTFDKDDSNVPGGTCNQFTYAFLLTDSGLNCLMSLVLLVAICMRKTLLLRLYMVHLCGHMCFCFYCWLAVLLAFRGTVNSTTLLSVWGVVLILSSVYFAMEVWIMRGAYDAIRQERAKRRQAMESGTGSALLSMGGFIL